MNKKKNGSRSKIHTSFKKQIETIQKRERTIFKIIQLKLMFYLNLMMDEHLINHLNQN